MTTPTMTIEPGPGDGTHDWFVPEFIGYECCRLCGIVRRRDRQNKACRGRVTVGPRIIEQMKEQP